MDEIIWNNIRLFSPYRKIEPRKKADDKRASQSAHASHIPVATKKPSSSQKFQVKQLEEDKKSVSSGSSISKSVIPKPTTSKSLKTQSKQYKLKVVTPTPTKPASRNVSPAPAIYRTGSKSTSSRRSRAGRTGVIEDQQIHHSRVGSRFASPVRVEDLAYKPCISPVPLLLQNPEFKRSRPDVKKPEHKDRAFVILDKELNNNHYYDQKHNKENNLYKEQRWMSSWYSPPF